MSGEQHNGADADLDAEDGPHYEFREEPIQLIEFKGNNFKLNPEALDMLEAIREEIIVVSVVGKARTGKSYLMNLLLDIAGKGKGFKVDSKIASCTRGIWIWGNYRKSLNKKPIIFIDSEGTSSTDRSTKTYDSRIFALVVLISSLFVYNTTANIDEHGISELSLAAHLSNAISTNNNTDKEAVLTELAPKFIWLIRDFTLDKIHPETGQEISSKEYLEICLRKKTSGKNSSDNNLIRNNIIKYFPERDCVTLVRPVDSELDLQKLDKVPYDKLKASFKLEFKTLKDKVYKETLPKKFSGKRLNGPGLAHFLMEVVTAINSGSVPNINSSWDSIIMRDINSFYQKALGRFKKRTANLAVKQYEQEDLTKHIYDIKLSALMIFAELYWLNSDVFSNESYLDIYNETKAKLVSEMEKNESKLLVANKNKTAEYLSELIKNCFKELNKKMYDEYYTDKLSDEMGEDYFKSLEVYEEKAIGVQKLVTLNQQLVILHREMTQYMSTTMAKGNSEKVTRIELELNQMAVKTEDEKKRGEYLQEELSTYESRVKNVERDININERQAEDLNERLDALQKQLEIAEKQSKEAGYKYKEPESSAREPPNLEKVIEDSEQKTKRKGKGKSCGCKCTVY